MNYIAGLDDLITRSVAGFQGHHVFIDRLFGPLFALPACKTYPYVIVSLALWFANSNNQRVRENLIGGALGAVLAMFLTHALQWLAPEKLRPIQTGEYPFVWGRLGFDASSFPSDTMGLTCALALGLWAVSRKWGVLAFAWTLIVVAGGKIYSGQHYLSDLVVGAMIGLASTALCLRLSLPAWFDARLSAVRQWRPTAFYLIFFLAAFQVGSLFEDVRLTENAIFGRNAFDPNAETQAVSANHTPYVGGKPQ